jgi:hypothetical protein
MKKLILGVAALAFVGASNVEAVPITLHAVLSGANEAPPNGSPATGLAIVTYDDIAHTLAIDVTFAGLTAANTAAHIHCCTTVPLSGTAGVATTTPTFVGFPAGTAGVFSTILDLTLATSYRAGFITNEGGGTIPGAEAALAAGLLSYRTYFNIHTSTFPGGEIRGFLVPEPGTIALLAFGLAGLVSARRKS